MATTTHGPFKVVDKHRNTGITVKAGDRIGVLCSGMVNTGTNLIGIGSPVVDADGVPGSSADAGFPAPGLREYSLICRVGPKWYQGGINASFTSTAEGTLILSINDWKRSDNSGHPTEDDGWQVVIYHTPAGEPPPTQGTWSFTTLDGAGGIFGREVGQHAAAAAFQGQLHVFYTDWSSESGPVGFPSILRHAAVSSGSTTRETLDGEGGTSGRTTNMVGEYDISAVVHGGRLHVFYFDLIDSNLRHASFDGTTWAFEVVEGSIVSGGFPTTLGPQVSAVSDGTNLHVFYARSGGATAGGETFHLRHAKHDGTNWQIETLDGTGGDDGRILAPVGWAVTTIPETIYTGTPTGRIFVFYSESVLEGDVFPTHTNLRLAWWDATTSRWRFATLDGAGGLNGRTRARVGGTSAAVIHENEVHVFYHDATYSNLRHGWATVGDLDYWQFQALDGTGGLHGRVKSEIGLARMAAAAFADQISVFYWNATRHNLRHAWWKGAGTSWLFETLDGDGGAQGRIEADIRGAVAAMNLTGSLFSGVGVFYYDHTNTDLRFASFS